MAVTTALDPYPRLDSTKSPNDRNKYRLVRLSNGIEALLVSNDDQRKQKAACACCVQVGSFSDPAGRCEGLAHYCEHMLFLGSRKYPGESQFEAFLSENGGDSNAFTECEYTCYYFEVNRKALAVAIDMFAQLFHEPLFTKDASGRELQAIESEFQKKRRSDGVRTATLFASFAREGHPWTSFGWGNLQSLEEEPARKGVDLHAELQNFFRSNYKPNRMRVCVFGIESLDSMQEELCKSFGQIPSAAGTLQFDFAGLGLPLDAATLPKLIRVRPIKDEHSLSMSWQLPSQLAYELIKPASYVCMLLGDEGHGSILSLLKDLGLATELCASSDSDNFCHSTNSMVCSVEVTLTAKGVQEWQAVVGFVFQYVKLLRSFGDQLPAWPYEERRLMADMKFRYVQEKDPSDLTVDLSTRMLPMYCHEAEHLLVGPYRFDEFRVDLIHNILEGLSVRGCFLMLLSSSYGRASVAAEVDAASSSVDGSDAGDGSEEASECEKVGATEQRVGPAVTGVVSEAKRQRVEAVVGSALGSEEDAPPFTGSEGTSTASMAVPPLQSRCLDPLFDAAVEADQMRVEPRFGTEYWDSTLEETLLRQWEVAAPDARLRVMPPNAFIATEFGIQMMDEDSERTAEPCGFQRSSIIDGFPLLRVRQVMPPRKLSPLKQVDGPAASLVLWYLNCAEHFKQPRSEISMKITCPYYAFDPTNVSKTVLADLYVECLQDSLNEVLYPASKANLHCSVSTASHGLNVRAHGFSEKLLDSVDRVLGSMTLGDYCTRSALRFQAQREEVLRHYRNAWLKPNAHCADLRRILLMPTYVRPVEKERALAAAGVPEFRAFVEGVFAKVACEVLVCGNTSRTDFVNWAHNSVVKSLVPTAQQLVDHDVAALKPGTASVLLEFALDLSQPNSALEIYWQLPGRDGYKWDEDRTRVKVLLDLLEQIMYEPVYDALRTKQQLGYSVGCSSKDSMGALGFSICIVSAVQRPPVLLERIEAFIVDFGSYLHNLPQEKFVSNVISLASRWLEPKRTLSELHATCFTEVSFGHPIFDRSEREAAVLGTLTKQDLLLLFDKYFAPGAAGRACLVTAVAPQKRTGAVAATPLGENGGAAAGCGGADRVVEAEALRDVYAGPGAEIVVNEADFFARRCMHPSRVAVDTALAAAEAGNLARELP
eukprot:TRINITY_DN29830_c0_g1_i1.p1 TRINITY_DN29830_c0_g1~~TRINITY_DN29830_c0_g1_i1.p1  ORF type:complete len:1165 (+),score=210.41 TRINITY_DN29830_c0_g1_i1:130-3624(+)